jgi:hypothetical protein
MDRTTWRLTGKEIRALMRVNRKTISGISSAWNLTKTRVRYVREYGVRGEAYVHDWLHMLCS